MRKMIICSTVVLFVFSLGIGYAFGLSNIEMLGKKIYMDENLSLNSNQSCKTCHHPAAGFADKENKKDPYNSVVSTGSDGFSVGGRNAPTAAYAGFSPVFHWDDTIGGYVGGMFWDGRATGETLQDPLAEQAQGPPLNPVEMAMPDADAVVAAVASSNYAGPFMEVFPETDFNDVGETYDNIARAIAAYERSSEITRFSSRFDQFWEACGIDVNTIDTETDLDTLPQEILSERELEGLALFNDTHKGNCAACHLTTDYVDANSVVFPPLFTDFTYDNLGIPKSDNPLIADNPVDCGLGGRNDIKKKGKQLGKFKVPTLRNIAKTPPYGHNGYFATLEDIVRFYNTRDVVDWDDPEVPENVNTEELGNLGLTPDEERSIVVFMRSLNDKH
ncbi:MAG: cytochrome c peroxidase [Thermodesulfobacteriota bacterium]|nr:cytochrome c peroxidase [Thermodesulfobacteriota bacterium]